MTATNLFFKSPPNLFLEWAYKKISRKDLNPSPKKWKQVHLTEKDRRIQIVLAIESDFSKLNSPEQKELVCAAQMFIFAAKVKESNTLSEEEKNRIIQIVYSRMSRIHNCIDQNIFNTGDYPNIAPNPEDQSKEPIEHHLQTGGNSSAFRGITETQDEEILQSTRYIFKSFEELYTKLKQNNYFKT